MSNIWKELHNTVPTLSIETKWKKMLLMFDEVKKTLGFASSSCGCYQGAIEIVNFLICFRSDISLINDFDFFIWLLHNEVNFKLNKKFFLD